MASPRQLQLRPPTEWPGTRAQPVRMCSDPADRGRLQLPLSPAAAAILQQGQQRHPSSRSTRQHRSHRLTSGSGHEASLEASPCSSIVSRAHERAVKDGCKAGLVEILTGRTCEAVQRCWEHVACGGAVAVVGVGAAAALGSLQSLGRPESGGKTERKPAVGPVSGLAAVLRRLCCCWTSADRTPTLREAARQQEARQLVLALPQLPGAEAPARCHHAWCSNRHAVCLLLFLLL